MSPSRARKAIRGRFVVLASCLASIAAVGCGASVHDAAAGGAGGGSTSSAASASGAGGAGGAPSTGIAWSPCPLYVDQPDGTPAECATIDVPLRWAEPDGPKIGIFVQRLRGTAGIIRGQLWLLEGGPGGSGADFDAWMERMRAVDPTLDLYAVDHRGVGRSAPLRCPAEETAASDWGIQVSPAEAAACRDEVVAKWGDDLAEFTTTAAARDLGYLIDVARTPGQYVFVYGVSYGTYWAHRYLQVRPGQASAVVLDSIAPPGESFVHYDSDLDAVGQDFFDLCAADALCASKLGADPWAALVQLDAALDGGHCPELAATWGLDVTALRTVLAYLLMSPVLRTYAPALVYRLARCDAADVTAIDRLLTVLFGTPTTTYYDTLSSDALFYNVALSELWPNPGAQPTPAEVDAVEQTLAMSTALTPRVVAVQDVWPAYPDDAFVGAWAETSTPLLMMNGDLDPLTPIWVGGEAADHFTGTRQWFVTIPRAAHAVTVQTPVAHDGDVPCGLLIMFSFLSNGGVQPDTSCLAKIPAEEFTGVPANNDYLLGTSDLWENVAPAWHAPDRAPPGLARALRDVARRAR